MLLDEEYLCTEKKDSIQNCLTLNLMKFRKLVRRIQQRPIGYLKDANLTVPPL